MPASFRKATSHTDRDIPHPPHLARQAQMGKQVGYNESIFFRISHIISSHQAICTSLSHPLTRKKTPCPAPAPAIPVQEKAPRKQFLFIQFPSLLSLLHFSTLSHHMLNQPTGQGARINVHSYSTPNLLSTTCSGF
jgi:hypothetical protein